MKNFRRIFAVSAMFFAAASLLSAQGLRESIQENPAYYCANHASYLFKDVVDTPAPEGYVPFYISHMARHGSRFDGGNSSVEKALKYLNVLDGAGMLTKEGKKLLELENLYYTLQKDNVGMLTSVGRYEHRTLGERMYKRFNEVFTNPERPNVDAVSTTVIRSITSMSSCTQALRSKSGKSDMPLHLSMRYGTDTDS
ncbi:MAG: hypothetical protein K5984_06710, partial [Bacteroidales bacterium]|nr:hypothetical protein [Bacteroidales bacterium]